MRDLFAKDTKRANLLGYGGGTWSRLFCWRNNIAMSRASSLRAAEFVGALARSHTTDTNIQSERSDLPAKMTSHEVFFNLNQVDRHFGFTATLTKSEKRQFTMLIPVPGGQSRLTHRDWLRYIFDLLWLLLYSLCIIFSLLFPSLFIRFGFYIRRRLIFICFFANVQTRRQIFFTLNALSERTSGTCNNAPWIYIILYLFKLRELLCIVNIDKYCAILHATMWDYVKL